MAISDIAGFTATSATFSSGQSVQRANQQTLQAASGAETTEGANTPETAVNEAAEGDTPNDRQSSSGSPFRGSQVDITV